MKYLMLVVVDPSLEKNGEPPLTIEEWVGETYGNGKATDGDRLRPPADAKTVRRRGGKVIVTDGPFAETHEWIAGFDILECADLDEALEIASRHPMATGGIIELRPAWPLDL
ncbi:YciI family protein [Microbacterium sp. B2969]|uniref:YciI family protein n=1 Tax=Microbacterium alkaliflavum TaxID=3248839 RepID=A0ABW7Q3M3_9MICO